MESAQRLVENWMASSKDEEIGEIISEISGDRLTLLNIVKALGEYLTSEDDDLRTKGVNFLSLVLSRCPAEKLNRQTVHVLITFYCEKLDDTETIIPALKGLSTLTALSGCSPIEAESTVHALFKHVRMRVLVHSVRFQVLSIIDNIMARNREALKAMGKVFLSGYIALAEGEKDPRNLLVAFAIVRVILIEFDISDHVESLFNITFCYFPITFRPPPNDPYGIATEDLQKALRGCLNATPSFGSLAIPLFLEKLTAGSPATKRDTLQTMSLCLPVYGAALARVSARKLWNSLKLEIFQPTDPQTESEALKTTQVLVTTIYSQEEAGIESDDDIQGLAKEVCEECIHILREPEKNQARPATKVLCAFMATTPSVSRYTLSQAIPHLVRLFVLPDEVINRAPILVLLAELTHAARDSMSLEIDEGAVPMMPYKDEVLGLVSVGVKIAASRVPALALLEGLITTKRLLTDEELGFIVHFVNEVFQSDEADSDDFNDTALLENLTTISKTSPRHVQEQTLPLLFSSLPDQAPGRKDTSGWTKCRRALSALKTLCSHPELFETLVIRLTAKLDLICVRPTNHEARKDIDLDAAYAHSILKTIANTLTAKVDASHPDVAKYSDRLVPFLYNLFTFSALHPTMCVVATERRLVETAGQIITLVIQCVQPEKQVIFVKAIFDFFSSGDLQSVATGLHKFPSDIKLHLLDASISTVQRNLLALFSSGVIPSYKEVLPSFASIDAFLDHLLAWSIVHADHNLQRESAWHLVSSVINKHANASTAFLEDKLVTFWPRNVANAEVSTEQRRRGIQAWIWMTKALMVCKHELLIRFTDRLFEVFADASVAWDAAKALGEIANPDEILTKRHHTVIKILHAQKFASGILPQVIAGAQDTTKATHERTAYLVALTSLIKTIPKTTYSHQMSLLMPLLLRGLDLADFDIRADVIDTFLAAAQGDGSDHSLVSEHASTLVDHMLKNSMADEMPSVRVRKAAVQYLGVLPSVVRYDILHPSKPLVLRELAKVLDDPKRSVRKEAVDTRTTWFKYSA